MVSSIFTFLEHSWCFWSSCSTCLVTLCLTLTLTLMLLVIPFQICHLDSHFHEFLLLAAYSFPKSHSDRFFYGFLVFLTVFFVLYLGDLYVMCFHAILYCYNFPDFLFSFFFFLFSSFPFFTWIIFASLALFCVLGTTLQNTELYHNNLHLRALLMMHCTVVLVALCGWVLLILFLSFLSFLLPFFCQCHQHFLLLLLPSPSTTPAPHKIFDHTPVMWENVVLPEGASVGFFPCR